MPIQRWSEDIWVVRLNAEPALSDDLVAFISEVQESGVMPDLVVELSSVTHLNSSSMSKLLRIRKLAIDNDKKLRIAAVPDPVWALFLTVGLDKIFDFSEDVPNALAAIQLDS